MEKLIKLDEKYFSPEHCIDRKTTKLRLQINSKTDIAAFNDDSLMGYISLYPIPRNMYEYIIKGSFNETEIERSTIPYRKIGVYDAYLCGMVIDKENYPRFKGSDLIKLLQNHLMKLRKRGIFINRIIAYAVSIPGVKTLVKMGFKQTDQDSIYTYSCFAQGYVFLKEIHVFNKQIFLIPKMVDV